MTLQEKFMTVITVFLVGGAVSYGLWVLLGKLLPPQKEEEIFISLPEKKKPVKKPTLKKATVMKANGIRKHNTNTKANSKKRR